ncbi:MAG: MarR family transcriptional regulator [Eubacteriales bacterium]|nr:MarR family transcriptional regulator [Eubacteriales bacterium]
MDKRIGQYNELIEAFDEGYELCYKYDSMPHQYGNEVLYQSEMHFLQAVGNSPNTTITAIASQLGKTTSACSQMVRKLRKKNLIVQERNENNNREYYLNLTEEGKEIYFAHEEFDKKCMMRTYECLDAFSDEEIQLYISIQKCLNKVFSKDVEENGVLGR